MTLDKKGYFDQRNRKLYESELGLIVQSPHDFVALMEQQGIQLTAKGPLFRILNPRLRIAAVEARLHPFKRKYSHSIDRRQAS